MHIFISSPFFADIVNLILYLDEMVHLVCFLISALSEKRRDVHFFKVTCKQLTELQVFSSMFVSFCILSCFMHFILHFSKYLLN